VLTVWCVCVGDGYKHDYVHILRNMVRRNLSIEHRFVCISDRHIDGIDTIGPPTNLQGWWQKLSLFKAGVAGETNLYLDLDVVVTGSLDELVARYSDKPLATPWNWARSGHGGCQSSVMLWGGKDAYTIYDEFPHEIAHWPPINKPPILWGDQEFITTRRHNGFPVTQIDADLVKSYKYHAKPMGRVPDNCRVVVFHGKPDPHECSEQWIKDAWC